MSDTEKRPVDRIKEILDECGADTFIIAVAEDDGPDKMRTMLALNGKFGDRIELLASIVRMIVAELKIPPDINKSDVIANVMSKVTRCIALGLDEEVCDL